MKSSPTSSIKKVAMMLLLVMIMSTSISAKGIEGKTAPDWPVDKWINLPDGQEELSISDYHGKVVYLFFFQSWCPGCHSYGIPTLQEVQRQFEGRDDLKFVAIQTVFEGFEINKFENAQLFAKKYDLQFPVGHSGENGTQSPLLGSYRSGGTPWTIIIDREGIVCYDGFKIKTKDAVKLVTHLLDNPHKSED